MHKKTAILTTIIFVIFCGGFFLFNLFLPDKSFSEVENRYLKQFPKFSAEELFAGELTSDFEGYISDQFALRDYWVAVKSRLEQWRGSRENNGVYIADDDTLIEIFETPDDKRLQNNLNSLKELVSKLDKENNVFVALAPTAAWVWRDKLPDGAPNYDQGELLQRISSYIDSINAENGADDKSNIYYCDLLGTLEQHRDEAVYYRTDHHWTSLGAYYAYCALGGYMGFFPVVLPNADEWQGSFGDFFGTIYSSSGVRGVEPDVVDIIMPDHGCSVSVNEGDGWRDSVMYDMDYAERKDKYSVFFGGNYPLMRINGSGEGSLLVVKDSFANSLLPYLARNYATIYVVDLRYYKYSVAEYVAENNIEDVLVLYNLSNFSNDNDLIFLGK